ncbi:MAG: DNA repair protein [Bacteroidetes bacterium]|nr:MAG: DNA repair protein [Bacteroidota bacterium]
MKTANLFNSTVAEIEITYRNRIQPSQMRHVSRSGDANDIFRDIWSDRMDYIEEFYILLVNRANKVLGYTRISQGGLSGTVVDPKPIFQAALKGNACSIILAHNHPSGNTKPSEADIRITGKIVEVGKALELPVLDHLILAGDEFFSFADNGMI